MDYYRPSAIKELFEDIDSMMTMDKVVENISPPIIKHEVVQGDTLWGIAKQYGTTVREILRLNPNIKNPDLIHPEDEIDVPRKPPVYEVNAEQSFSRPGITEGAVEPVFPESILGGMSQLAKLAAVGVPKGIAALAGAAPAALPRAGAIGNNMVRGAVNWPGAKPTMSNVRPVDNLNQGAVKAMLAKMQRQQAPNLRQQLNVPPNIPNMNPSATNVLRQNRFQPTLDTLRTAANGRLQGAGGNQSFQNILQSIGYGR